MWMWTLARNQNVSLMRVPTTIIYICTCGSCWYLYIMIFPLDLIRFKMLELLLNRFLSQDLPVSAWTNSPRFGLNIKLGPKLIRHRLGPLLCGVCCMPMKPPVSATCSRICGYKAAPFGTFYPPVTTNRQYDFLIQPQSKSQEGRDSHLERGGTPGSWPSTGNAFESGERAARSLEITQILAVRNCASQGMTSVCPPLASTCLFSGSKVPTSPIALSTFVFCGELVLWVRPTWRMTADRPRMSTRYCNTSRLPTLWTRQGKWRPRIELQNKYC